MSCMASSKYLAIASARSGSSVGSTVFTGGNAAGATTAAVAATAAAGAADSLTAGAGAALTNLMSPRTFSACA